MNLEEFHTMVDRMSSEMGASDALIPDAVRHAVMFLERNWDFVYMSEEVTVQYLAASPFPTSLTLGNRVKKVMSGETRIPGGVDGINEIALVKTPHVQLDDMEFEDKLPVLIKPSHVSPTEYVAQPLLRTSADVDLHFWLLRYTSWPLDNFDAFNHFLIDAAEDVLASQSLLALAAMNRDEGLAQFYSPKRVEELKTLIRADLLFEDGMEIK